MIFMQIIQRITYRRTTEEIQWVSKAFKDVTRSHESNIFSNKHV